MSDIGHVLGQLTATPCDLHVSYLCSMAIAGHCHVLNVNIETSAFQNEDRDKFKRSCKDMEHQASAAQHDLEDLQKAQMSDT